MTRRYSKRKRFILFFIGLIFAGLGVAFSTRPGLGTSPISSFPYVTTFVVSWTLGMATIIINIVFVLLQFIILRKRFRWVLLAQLPTLFAFGFFIDFGMWISSFYLPESYFLRFIETMFGCALLATGIAFQLLANISYMPGDGFIRTASEEYNLPFGTVKICFDVSMVVLAVSFSLVCLQGLHGVREGTILAAVLVGLIIKRLQPPLRYVKRFLIK